MSNVVRSMALARSAAAYEAGIWRSLYRWILRRPTTAEPGARAFSYTGVVMPILSVLIGLSVVELPILDLIISRTVPWEPARFIALAVGGYGLFWMLGLLASMKTHPHVVGPSGLRLRGGTTVDLRLDWDAIAAIHDRYRSLPSGRTVQIEHEQDRVVLNLCAGSQTSVDIALRGPRRIPLAGGPSEPVTEVRCYVDDPKEFTALIRQHLAAFPHHAKGTTVTGADRSAAA